MDKSDSVGGEIDILGVSNNIMRRVFLVIFISWLIILALLIYVHFKQANKFQVIFFDIGQGDSALINFSDGRQMLVDCGPDKKVLAKLGKYLPFYDRTVDYLLITHFDLDHYGGCLDVLKRYEVKNIITNGEIKPNDKYWQAWNQAGRQEQANEVVIWQTSTWPMASSTLEFLAPAKNYDLLAGNSNNQSIVFRLTQTTTTILFTGDMEQDLEEVLLKKYCSAGSQSNQRCPALMSDILKVGHHGSDSSSGARFLFAVDPQTAIISVGRNKFGHPSLRVLAKLGRLGVNILRTDQRGDIIIRY